MSSYSRSDKSLSDSINSVPQFPSFPDDNLKKQFLKVGLQLESIQDVRGAKTNIGKE
jgi:hypothetical protein